MARAGELVRLARENRRGAIRPQARPEERSEVLAARAMPARQPEPAAGPSSQARFAGASPDAGARSDAGAKSDAGARPDAGARSEFQPHHGAYSALMRSHDRMRTQHLPVQGGGNRA